MMAVFRNGPRLAIGPITSPTAPARIHLVRTRAKLPCLYELESLYSSDSSGVVSDVDFASEAVALRIAPESMLEFESLPVLELISLILQQICMDVVIRPQTSRDVVEPEKRRPSVFTDVTQTITATSVNRENDH